MCDRIGLVRDGRLHQVGSLNELRTLRVHRIEAVFNGTVDPSQLARVPGVTEPTSRTIASPARCRGSVAPLLDALAGVDVVELDSHEMSLEEVFFGEFEPEPELPAASLTPSAPIAAADGRVDLRRHRGDVRRSAPGSRPRSPGLRAAPKAMAASIEAGARRAAAAALARPNGSTPSAATSRTTTSPCSCSSSRCTPARRASARSVAPNRATPSTPSSRPADSRTAVLRDRAIGFAIVLAVICDRLRRRARPVDGRGRRRRDRRVVPHRPRVRRERVRRATDSARSSRSSSAPPAPRTGSRHWSSPRCTCSRTCPTSSGRSASSGSCRPFHYFNESRALVPGHGFSVAALRASSWRSPPCSSPARAGRSSGATSTPPCGYAHPELDQAGTGAAPGAAPILDGDAGRRTARPGHLGGRGGVSPRRSWRGSNRRWSTCGTSSA